MEKGIELKPTTGEFAIIASRLASQLSADWANKRRVANLKILNSLLEVVRYLAIADPDECERLIKSINAD